MQEQSNQQFIDRQQITDVLNEYCHALDRMDLPRLASLFTEDCVVDYGPREQLQSRGAAALEKSLERMWRWSRTSHHLSNISIRFERDGVAHARSYVYAWHERPDGSQATILGQYHDHLVRDEGVWRIAERRMEMNGCDEGFTVNINPFERLPAPDDWVSPDID